MTEFNRVNCPICGASVLAPVGVDAFHCTECGKAIVRASDGSLSAGRPASGAGGGAPQTSSQVKKPADNAFLAVWKTSVGASIGGVIVSMLVGQAGETIGEVATSVEVLLVITCIAIAYPAASLYWALGYYPRLFGENPPKPSSEAVSFGNCFFGGIIFGPIWNSNLTKREKGVSNVVYAVLLGCVAVFELVVFAAAFSA